MDGAGVRTFSPIHGSLYVVYVMRGRISSIVICFSVHPSGLAQIPRTSVPSTQSYPRGDNPRRPSRIRVRVPVLPNFAPEIMPGCDSCQQRGRMMT